MEKRPLNFLSYFLVFLLIGFCHSIAQVNYSYQYEWHNDISETVLEKSIVNEPFVYNASVTFTKSTTEIFDTHYAPACKGTYHLSLKNVGSTAISDLEIFDHIPSVLEVLDVEFDSSLFNITQNGNEYTFTLIQGQEITSDQSIDIFIDFKIDKNVAPGDGDFKYCISHIFR